MRDIKQTAIMNVNNGEVLALGSSPSYDPNIFAKVIRERDFKRLSSKENGEPLLNRAVQDGVAGAHGVRRSDLEHAVRDTVRRVPSCSLWCPVPGLPDGAEAVATVRLATGAHVARYRAERGGAWVLGVDPVPASGTMGPVVVALARGLGGQDPATAMVAFDDDSVRSRWGVQRSADATEASG